MTINLDALSYEQLLALNQAVVARIKAIRSVRQQMQVMAFNVGDTVVFLPDGHDLQRGVITRCNLKTVTVAAESGVIWRVAPVHLQRIATVTQPATNTRSPAPAADPPLQLPLIPEAAGSDPDLA